MSERGVGRGEGEETESEGDSAVEWVVMTSGEAEERGEDVDDSSSLLSSFMRGGRPKKGENDRV